MIGCWSFALGFKLDALDSKTHHHIHADKKTVDEEKTNPSANGSSGSESNIILDEKVRTLAKGRAVAFGFKEEIEPIIVDSPPPGINFTNCVMDAENKYCCIDFVSLKLIFKNQKYFTIQLWLLAVLTTARCNSLTVPSADIPWIITQSVMISLF